MGWKKWRVCQLHEACHNQEKTILMAKDTRYFPIQGAGEVICGILPPIPINSCEDYTLEKDSFEHIKKYMML